MIGPYEHRPAVCRDYDPRAVHVAREVALLVADHLPHCRVEHVGSTAVPGCAGKGIIDLLMPVPQGAMQETSSVLERLGFQRQTTPEPFPEDRPMRVGAWQHDGECFLLHLHLIAADSPEIDEMRFFRACLRGDPELLRAYVAKKRAIIADGITDPLDYCLAKGEFIAQMLG